MNPPLVCVNPPPVCVNPPHVCVNPPHVCVNPGVRIWIHAHWSPARMVSNARTAISHSPAAPAGSVRLASKATGRSALTWTNASSATGGVTPSPSASTPLGPGCAPPALWTPPTRGPGRGGARWRPRARSITAAATQRPRARTVSTRGGCLFQNIPWMFPESSLKCFQNVP
jgi:hypothetical protein